MLQYFGQENSAFRVNVLLSPYDDLLTIKPRVASVHLVLDDDLLSAG